MDEVSLYNMPGNLLHESSMVVVPNNMHNTGNANQVLPMCFDRDVGSVVSKQKKTQQQTHGWRMHT